MREDGHPKRRYLPDCMWSYPRKLESSRN